MDNKATGHLLRACVQNLIKIIYTSISKEKNVGGTAEDYGEITTLQGTFVATTEKGASASIDVQFTTKKNVKCPLCSNYGHACCPGLLGLA